ncbi:S8 family serine peptidase [Isachenkonia alkalipeptolytica]|uniref:Lactocepin n=1 Tax=Isachenkonia alkalipeptolytica TaxID=2565777 RepID=A0AA44BG97_9CLOT|nr:S8 family serine peptidase [Isachenkonia alkalipeptolytica]NBG89610.1 hypothetical protein [Isachenkonia alkalipeptolytica]
MYYSKRKLAGVLVLLLVLSSLSMLGATPENHERNQVLENYLQQETELSDTPNRLNPEDFTTWDPDKEYRVIVQLTGDAAIEESKDMDEKYHELPAGIRKNLERGILGEQQGIIKMLERRGFDIEVLHNYIVGINGFSALAKGHEIEALKEVPQVKDVFISNEYERPDPTPEMEFTHGMIGSEAVWSELGYQGEGMVVAVVDTGIQWTHPDFNPDYEDYDLVVDEAHIDELELVGEYKTPKVVYGYNYFDNQQTVEDMNGNHGQHVAGTVAADGEIRGVAPKAQLVDIQVFSEDPETPSTSDDIYLRGIEDALKIGVDAVNMSLGAVASFYQPNSAVDEMITNAREDGVVFAISAGNSAYSTDGIGFPWRENPDVGLVGAPSLNKDSISVASMDNVATLNNYLTYEIDGEEIQAPYTPAGPFYIPDVLEEEEYVYAGLGGVEEDYIEADLEPQNDFEGLDLEGKVALISRGKFPFTAKIMNAQEAGAKAVIIFNNDGTNELINMQYPDNGEIPAMFIGSEPGSELAELEEPITLNFPDGTIEAPNPTAGEMSAFTSWGTTPTLDMKPEVTAPGGMIYSTLLDGQYGSMSGTSMAAPHVAGSTALVQQYLLNEGMDREDVAEMSKIRHMNTADPIEDPFGNLYSPRRQGAGMIRPDKAIMSPVTVVNEYDGEAKVQLRDFEEEEFTMTLEATNHSEEAVTYDVEVDVIVDELIAVLMWQWMDSAPLVDAVVTGDEEVTIEPGATETVTVTVDISEAKIPAFHPSLGYEEYPVVDYPNLFVEGFIRLIDQDDVDGGGGLDLVVPYVGFYGDWAGENSPRVLDGFDYYGEASVFGNGVLVDQDGFILGFDPEYEDEGLIDRIAISPGNEDARYMAIPVFSMMRNAAKIEFRALNEDGEVVREIHTEEWLRKSFANNPGYYIEEFGWDGMDDEGNIVEDGQYYYEIAALPHYEDAVWQTKQISLLVDTKAPVAEEVQYDQDAKELSWTVSDEGVGPVYMELRVDGEVYEDFIAREQEYVIEDFEFRPNQKVEIMIEDYAGNEGVYELSPSLMRGNRPPHSFQPNPGRGRGRN